MNKVIFGKVTHYFLRFEYQQREVRHIQLTIWVEAATVPFNDPLVKHRTIYKATCN